MSRLVSSRKKKSNNVLKISLCILFLIGVALLVWFLLTRKSEKDTVVQQNDININYDVPSEEEKQVGEQISEPSKTTDSENANDNTGNLDTYIPFAGFVDGELQVTTQIEQLITGKCTLTVSQNTTTIYTETVDIAALPSSSTCNGFHVSGLSSSEQYTIKILIEASDGRSQEISADQ